MPVQVDGDESGLPARRDRYGSVTAAVRNWQIAALVAGLALLLTLGAHLTVVLRPAALHVIEVDRHRNVVYSGPERTVSRDEPAFAGAQLREWISKARTVTADRELQSRFVNEVNARTRESAAKVVEALKAERNPFVVMRRSRISVEEISVLPVPSTSSLEAQWTEVRRSAIHGGEEGRTRWRALVAFRWVDVDDETVTMNPAGFVVTALEISQLD